MFVSQIKFYRICNVYNAVITLIPRSHEQHQSRIGLPPEDDDVLLRADFVREVDALLQEVRAEQASVQSPQGFDSQVETAGAAADDQSSTQIVRTSSHIWSGNSSIYS